MKKRKIRKKVRRPKAENGEGGKEEGAKEEKGAILSQRVPGKLRSFIQLLRPFTLMAPILGGTSAAIISYRVNTGEMIPWPVISDTFPYLGWDFPHIMDIIWGVIALVFVNAASNTLNQVHDLEIDAINKPYRPIPRGIITKDEARTLAWIFYLVTLWRASFMNRSFAFFILLIMLMTIAYSAPPIRFKKRLWVNNFSIAFTRGILGFVAAWCIFDENPFDNPDPWAMGLIMCIFLFGTITTKDFNDVKGDKAFGMRTLPVVYGVRFSAAFTALFFIFPFMVLPLMTIWRLLIPQAFILTTLVGWGVYVLILIYEAAYAEEDTVFENSPVWKHMYLMLMALQLGFLFIYYYYY